MNKLMTLTVLFALLAGAALAGGPKAPKPAAAGAISRSASCWKRFNALCGVMQRCSSGAEDMGGARCEAIDPGCDALDGQASYPAAAVDACLAGLEKLSCGGKADPNDRTAMDFEGKVAACRKLVAADTELAKAGEASPNATASR